MHWPDETFTQAAIDAGLLSYAHDGSETMRGGRSPSTTAALVFAPPMSSPITVAIEALHHGSACRSPKTATGPAASGI